jgi:hypothetical protein
LAFAVSAGEPRAVEPFAVTEPGPSIATETVPAAIAAEATMKLSATAASSVRAWRFLTSRGRR